MAAIDPEIVEYEYVFIVNLWAPPLNWTPAESAPIRKSFMDSSKIYAEWNDQGESEASPKLYSNVYQSGCKAQIYPTVGLFGQ